MVRATRTIDITGDGITTQALLIVDRNAQNEEAVGRVILLNDALVSNSNRFPVDVVFPTTQPVSLATLPTLAAGNNAIGSVSVSNFPGTQPVSLTTLPPGTNALGSVSVSNFPTTQPVSLLTLPALATGANVIGSVGLQVASAAVADINPLPVKRIDAAPITETALTAVGTTTAQNVAGFRFYSYQITIANIGTSLTIRMEGTHMASPTANDWYSLQPNNIDQVINANGSYKLQIAGETDLLVRMNLLTITGGTPTVTCTLIKGN